MDCVTTRVKVCFSLGHHAKVVLTCTALIRTLLLGRARNFTTREIKRCTLDLYKFKHCMRDQRPFDRVNGNLNLLRRHRWGVYNRRTNGKIFSKAIIDVKGQGDVLTFR